MSSVARILAPFSGSVHLEGTKIHRHSTRRKYDGRKFLTRILSVFKNQSAAMSGRTGRCNQKKDVIRREKKKADQILSLFGRSTNE